MFESFTGFADKTTEKLSIEQTTIEKIENQIRFSHAQSHIYI